MPEIASYSLSSVLKRIKSIIEEKTTGKQIWIKAEISSINFNQASGHCYLELVEIKDKITTAQCRATIWASRFNLIKHDLGVDFNNIIKKGSEILFLAEIIFNEVYGFSLNICKVGLNFNLGDLEKRKQETIDKLKSEGIIDKNKSNLVPVVIKRIALIASTSTNGYNDFYKQLNNNQYGYVFEVTDFPVSVQGENAISDICNQLAKLNSLDFDIVAIIRGGGSKLDLDVFNSYNIAKAIALHNLPVFTGIGHENDFSVTDLVASMFHKTPTALGAYIVELTRTFEVKIMTIWVAIKEIKMRYFDSQKSLLELYIQTLTTKSTSITRLRRGDLHTTLNRINTAIIEELNNEKRILSISKELISSKPKTIIQNSSANIINSVELIRINFSSKIKQAIEEHSFYFDMIATYARNQCIEKSRLINNILEVINVFHPKNILNKGYAIPLHKGELLGDQDIKPNDEIEIELLNKTLIVLFLKTKGNGKYYLRSCIKRAK